MDIVYGYRDLCKGLLAFLDKDEKESCEVNGVTEAQRVFEYFAADYVEVTFNGSKTKILRTEANDSHHASHCICGVPIVHNFYLRHRLRPDEEIVVGSVCIKNFDPQLAKDIDWTMKVKAGDKVCTYCSRRNANGNHGTCERRVKNEEVLEHLKQVRSPEGVYYLDVAYSEKDEAKARGAKWDGVRLQKWYAPTMKIAKRLYWDGFQFISPTDMAESKRVYFNIKFEERDVARTLGARWDSSMKRWFTLSTAVSRALQDRGFEKCED